MTSAQSDAAGLGGLTSQQAAATLGKCGPNRPVPVARRSAPRQILQLFANPLVLILLAASAVSASLGQHTDAAIIAAIVLMSVSINFWQTYRSQKAADHLRAAVAPTATVSRDDVWQEVDIARLVPGDVVRLSAGDLIPADARLAHTRDLSVQQSMLTGESLPVEKEADTAASGASRDPQSTAFVFMGTSVVSGTGIAVVTATGSSTVFGDVASRLNSRPPEAEFERGLRRFSLLILRTTMALVLLILLLSLASKRDPFESLLFAVALGVGLTPEFLPMIASITLTSGAMRMAKHGVIVKHLPAMQNFGSIDILCSDKTGTLTSGQMEVQSVVDARGANTTRAFDLAFLNSHFQTGIRSPLDAAILRHGVVETNGFEKVDELPFDFERRRLSVVLATASETERRLLITKGAFEAVLNLVTAIEIDGRIEPSTEASIAQSRETAQQLSAAGLRVLAVAYRWAPRRDAYAKEDESALTLAGFIAFSDPVLPDVAGVLANLAADGVSVKIITGDNEQVVRHVCASIGVAGDRVVTGDELDSLDDGAVGHVAEQASMFCRVSPAQKNRIIIALKRRGHVVGYMGDGINDAPSLHTADVGISVMSATDVARDAADVILSQPSLAVLHEAILEGRRASGNMMKYLLMGTSSNFGNMFSMAIASVFLPFLPMLPTQILLNNFLYDLAQIAIPGDRVDRSYLSRPQRWDIRVIRDFMVFIGPISSAFDFLTFFGPIRVFHAGEVLFHTGWFVESLASQTLVLFVIRTMGNPLKSRPSVALTLTTLAIAAVGFVLPVTPFAGWLGFTPLPGSYLLFVIIATVAYLGLVEVAKRVLVRHSFQAPTPG